MAISKAPFVNQECCKTVVVDKFIKIIQNSQVQDIYDNLTPSQIEALGEIVVGDPCVVENSNVTFQETILSGETLVLEDYDFELQDPDGVVISNTAVPAMIGEEIIVGANGLCPTEFDFNLNINGQFQEIVTVDTFSDINITIK